MSALPVTFKIGQFVILNNSSRARVLGAGSGPRRYRVMRLDGTELDLPAGDLALPGEDAAIAARQRNLSWKPVGPTAYGNRHGGYLTVPSPDSDDAY